MLIQTHSTTMIHRITFPQFAEDIATKKRTLLHSPFDGANYGGGMMVRRIYGDVGARRRKLSTLANPRDMGVPFDTFGCPMPPGTEFNVHDSLVIVDANDHDKAALATITKLDVLPLDVTTAELAMLAVESKAEYYQRWDATQPERLASTRPLVWRIEFSYDRGPIILPMCIAKSEPLEQAAVNYVLDDPQATGKDPAP